MGALGDPVATMVCSLTCWLRHLTQQRMQSPVRARKPRVPPSTTARNILWFNPLDKTGRRGKGGNLVGDLALAAGNPVSTPGTVKKERKTVPLSRDSLNSGPTPEKRGECKRVLGVQTREGTVFLSSLEN